VHPRKIASVMRYNKEPLVYPCYKVLADSGKISGYNTDRWVIEKIEKLESDGIKTQDGKVDKKYFI
jgi:O6-methylguanine-DNA--protein-cysteine methyltransferase